MIGITILATNSYFVLGLRLVQNLNKYYKGKTKLKIYFFSDTNINEYITADNIEWIPRTHNSWVQATNSKFSNILEIEEPDYIIYMDADTNVENEFDDSLFLHYSIGAEHFTQQKPLPYDRNLKSYAYIPLDTRLKQVYYQGAFFGGKKEFIHDFCKQCIKLQKLDKEINNYEPVWNDESYLNNIFHYNAPKHTIKLKDFPFTISDKGGLQEIVRHTKIKLDDLKQFLLENKDKEFNIINKQINITQ